MRQLFWVIMLCMFSAVSFAEDNSSISVYYPSPYGEYAEVRSARLVVGSNYMDASSVVGMDGGILVESGIAVTTGDTSGTYLNTKGVGARLRVDADLAGVRKDSLIYDINGRLLVGDMTAVPSAYANSKVYIGDTSNNVSIAMGGGNILTATAGGNKVVMDGSGNLQLAGGRLGINKTNSGWSYSDGTTSHSVSMDIGGYAAVNDIYVRNSGSGQWLSSIIANAQKTECRLFLYHPINYLLNPPPYSFKNPTDYSNNDEAQCVQISGGNNLFFTTYMCIQCR